MDVESRLQLEYLKVASALYKAKEYIEIEIKHTIKTQLLEAVHANKILISSRVKDCNSAITALKKKEEGRVFRDGRQYSITQLNDLIGLRISVFPLTLLELVQSPLLSYLENNFEQPFQTDHTTIENYDIYKYRGIHNQFSEFNCEIQLIPMLISKFWDTEHDVFYKPASPHDAPPMKEAYDAVIKSLYSFEKTYEESQYKAT